MNKLDIEKKIEEIILQIRPYINDDGGDIEFIKYEDNYVFKVLWFLYKLYV